MVTFLTFDDYWDYITILYERIPQYIVEIGLFLLIASIVFLWIRRDVSHRRKQVFGLWLFEYVFIIYGSTVLFRVTNCLSRVEVEPLRKYDGILTGKLFVFDPEMLMNILVFVPLGFLLGLTFKRLKWRGILLTGFGISLSIEIIQYFLRRGTAEVDDLIHNTIGCFIGYGIFLLSKIIYTQLTDKVTDG